MKPTEVLMNEHSAILIVLSVMRKIANDIRSGNHYDLTHLDKIVEFLRVFADRCHHAKEEKILFPAMEDAGISRDNGPVGVMLYEHTLGRELIATMMECLSNARNGNEDERENTRLADAMIEYANLLENHIAKENNILFPMADHVLQEEVQLEVARQFEKIEDEMGGIEEHEKFHDLIRTLEKAYLVEG